ENIELPKTNDQTSHDFYHQTPVTCLSSINYQQESRYEQEVNATTILSPVLSHTGSFTLLCIKRMFEEKCLQGVKKCYWYSDGGPHFRNQQLVCALLRKDKLLIPNIEFVINFCEPYHGKGVVDSLFGKYEIELEKNLDEDGINSIVDLKDQLRHLTFVDSIKSKSNSNGHEVI
ncbi:MAG: hypothetical protein EZS28_056019, partial [Streblomastix strix]